MVPVADIKTTRKTARPVIAASHCKGCGFCVEFCPKGLLAISTEFNAKGYYLPRLEHPEACTGCGLCERICPDFAIYLAEQAKI